MIEVSVHNPKPESAAMLGSLKTVAFRVKGGEEDSRVTIFFNRAEMQDMILALTEAEFMFGAPSTEERLTFTRQ